MTDTFATRLAEQLAPAYVIERELGGGGMSRVFLARDASLGRRVVLKVLPPELAAGVNTERFRREIVVVAGLQHPHIVPVLHAAETADGVLYYSMPFVEGESLRERLKVGRVPLPDVLRLLRDVASALSCAHEHGVVHRDMKPENILLSGSYALVADFGIAKALHNAAVRAASESHTLQTLTTVGESIGTPAYMSPEQVAGDRDIDARSDVYALGVIAYELVAGRVPFTGMSPRAILVAHLGRDPEPVRTLAPEVPTGLAALIMQCLAKEPSDRPASADAIVGELDLLMTAQPGNAVSSALSPPTPSTSLPETSVPNATRIGASRGRRAWMAGTALLAVAVAGFAVWRAYEPAPRMGKRIAVTSIAVTSSAGASATAAGSPLTDAAQTVSDALVAAVSGVDGVNILTRDEVVRAEMANKANLSSTALASQLGADFIVGGKLAAQGADSISVTLQLLDARGAVIRALQSATLPRANLQDAVAPIADRVAAAITIMTSETFGQAMLPLTSPPTQPALRAVEQGLRLEAGIAPAAPGEDKSFTELSRFDLAVKEDVNYLQARLWFASAATRQFGGEPYALSALAIVENESNNLTRYERTLLDALKADVSGNHELSLRSWREVGKLAPSWPNRWWLAMKLRDVNRPQESLALLDSLGVREPGLLRWTPSIQHYLGKYDAELKALDAEAARAPATANSLGMQQSYLQVLAAQGKLKDITQRFDEIVTMPAEALTTVAYLLTRTAWELDAHGYATESESVLARAANWCATRTNEDLKALALAFDCMEAYAQTGRTRELAALANPALATSPDDLGLIGLLGLTAALRGDSTLAEQFAGAIAQATRPGGARGLGWWLRARISAALGNKDDAVELLRDAFARGAGWSQRLDLHRDPAFKKLRGYPAFERLRAPQG